jgi:hypothetical protein
MARRIAKLAIGCWILSLVALPLMAHEEGTGEARLWVVYTEVVKPSMWEQYETVGEEMIAAMRAAKVDSPYTYFTILQGEDLTYTAVTPMEDFGDMSKIHEAWMHMGEKIGQAKWAELIRRGSETVDHSSLAVFVERPDLSYQPAAPRMAPGEVRFAEYSFYYLLPGREEEAAAILKDWAELHRKKKVAEAFRVFEAITGDDLPLLVVGTYGKNEVDWIDHGAEVSEALGEQGQGLLRRALGVIRRFEVTRNLVRDDLSYQPPQED